MSAQLKKKVILAFFLFSVGFWNLKNALFLGNIGLDKAKFDNNEVQRPGDEGSMRKDVLLKKSWRALVASSANQTHHRPALQIFENFIRPHKAIIQPYYNSGTIDVVVATHTSVSESKLKNLRICTEYWGGPVSVAVYIQSEEDINELVRFLGENADIIMGTTTIHIMLEHIPRPSYPHNILRNIAMATIESDYFVALDVDLIPSKNSYQGILSLLNNNSSETGTTLRQELHNKTMFILPAFEVFPKNYKYDPQRQIFNSSATMDQLPASKSELIHMTQAFKAIPFYKDKFPQGHRPTKFKKWYAYDTNNDESTPYYYYIRYRDLFEPYVLGYRHGNLPPYWPQFRGKEDKISWFRELNRAGYSFAVFRDFYVVHLNHPYSRGRGLAWNNEQASKKFKAHLDRKYPQTLSLRRVLN